MRARRNRFSGAQDIFSTINPCGIYFAGNILERPFAGAYAQVVGEIFYSANFYTATAVGIVKVRKRAPLKTQPVLLTVMCYERHGLRI
jgi:hypothetical protein